MPNLFSLCEKVKKNIYSFDVILLCFIICMHVNRYISLSIFNNITVLLVYFSFVFYSMYINFKFTHNQRNAFIILILILIYSLFYSLFIGLSSFQATLKLFISCLIAFYAYMFSIKKIYNTINIIYLYNIFYAILLLITPARANRLMATGSLNYLNITFTLGLALTISLCVFICSLYKMLNLKTAIISVLSVVIFTIVTSHFNARGSLIFPILSALIILLIISMFNFKQTLFVLPIVCIVFIICFNVYYSNSSKYIYNRMMSLFNKEDIANNNRIIMWIRYLNEINDKNWFVLGGGPNSSRVYLGYYPHNIVLQLLGEYGILGLFVGSVSFFLILKNIIIFLCEYRFLLRNKYLCVVFYTSFGSTLYYFFSFMKSFSLYEIYPLLIFASFIYKCTNVKDLGGIIK